MNRRFPTLAAVVALLVAGAPGPAHADPPAVTGASVSRATIYPLVGTPAHPAQTVITFATDDASSIARIEVRDAADVTVRTLDVPGLAQVTWNGRNDANGLVPVGTYHAVALSSTDEEAAATATIGVSGLRLLRRTYTRTVTAAGSLVDRYVGRCSTLRKPSKRRWRGSLGFYANTRCGKQTWRASAVSTAHRTRLPVAERYLDVRISTYGGAAVGHRRSRAVIRYFRLRGDAFETFFGGGPGVHRGPQHTTKDMVDARRYLTWGLATAYKSRYDVKSFTILLHYDVLG